MWPQDQSRERFPCDSISVEDLFHGLDPKDRKKLSSLEDHRTFSPDEVIFAAGDPPVNIYVHLRGRAALFQDAAGNTTVYACPVGPDRVYGLIEALAEEEFGMSMKTLTMSEFEVISTDDLLGFITERSALCFKLAAIVSRMYQRELGTIRDYGSSEH